MPSMLNCPVCGGEVSWEAVSCPGCGNPVPTPPSNATAKVNVVGKSKTRPNGFEIAKIALMGAIAFILFVHLLISGSILGDISARVKAVEEDTATFNSIAYKLDNADILTLKAIKLERSKTWVLPVAANTRWDGR